MGKSEKVKHVAIIMDGNGRWAQMQGKSRTQGHKAGAEAVIKTLKASKKLGIEYLTLYAFSTENWKRPQQEINALMDILSDFLSNKLPEIEAEKIRIKVMGRIEELPELVQEDIKRAVEKTQNNSSGTLTLALNYGGRSEIVDAAKKIAEDFKTGKISEINEEKFKEYLYFPELPDPDIIIRTSGEFRLSNFLLWQLSYSEIYISDVLWPDFSCDELKKALDFLNTRKRRFGGL